MLSVRKKKLMVYTNTFIYLGLSDVLMDYLNVCRQHLIIHNNITLEKTPNGYRVGQAAPLKVTGTRYKVQRWAAPVASTAVLCRLSLYTITGRSMGVR